MKPKFAVYLPHTAQRYQSVRFRKASCPIVERLVAALMFAGRNAGKKLLAVNIVRHAFEIVHLVSDKNPIQVILRLFLLWLNAVRMHTSFDCFDVFRTVAVDMKSNKMRADNRIPRLIQYPHHTVHLSQSGSNYACTAYMLPLFVSPRCSCTQLSTRVPVKIPPASVLPVWCAARPLMCPPSAGCAKPFTSLLTA